MSNIKPWEPEIEGFEPVLEAEDVTNRFARFLSGSLSLDLAEEMAPSSWPPAVDIQETPEAYVITAEIPDMKKEDVRVSVHDGVLSLSGERCLEKEEKNKKGHRIERSYGRFSRSFTVPVSADEARVSASFKNGQLIIQVPKLSPSSVREIKIH